MRASSKTLVHAAAAALAAAVAACGGGSGSGRSPGSESFVSQGPGSRGGPAAAGGAADGGSATSGADAAASARTVQEADIYAVSADGSTLYVLNGFRGLLVVGLADLDRPALLAAVPMRGEPVDLYLRGTIAYLTVRDVVTWGWAAGDAAVEPRGGSELWAVDVSAPARPAVLGRYGIEGSVQESRIVGDVLYVVSRRWGWWDAMYGASAGGDVAVGVGASSGGAGAGDAVYLASFDLADPRAPRPIARRDFDAMGWTTTANVTASRVTLAQSEWTSNGGLTRFSTFDISDPGGAIAPGATFEAPGRVQDRWGMDQDDGAKLFRAVLATGWNAGAALRTWATPDLATATPLGAVTVGLNEGLTAARFDGPSRAYVVTARSMDPLFAVDTSDPRRPTVTGALEMPGQLDFVEPRGDRLVALGHTNEGGVRWQLAASLFDVAASPPRLLSRVLLGDGYGWMNASSNDLRKAFQVLDAQGLVLVPFSGWDGSAWRYEGGVQLLDLSRDALVKRGFASHPGVITRAFPLPGRPGQLAAISDARLQLLDATDRDRPVERGTGLDLARPVSDLAFVNGAVAELAGDWYRGDTELAVVDPGDLDAPVPLARASVPAPQARLFTVGATAWLLAQRWAYGPQGSSSSSWLQAVDLSDPAHPRTAARLDLDAGAGGYGCGGGVDAVLSGSALVVHAGAWGGGPCAMAGGGGVVMAAGTGRPAEADAPRDELLVYDLGDPDAPRLASRVTLPTPKDGWSGDLTLSGGQVWISHYEPIPDSRTYEGRYYVDRVDVSRPDAARLLAKVNVPGAFLAAESGGNRVYTQETTWEPGPSGGAEKTTTWIHALDLTSRGTARLAGSVSLDGWLGGVVVDGSWAYAVRSGPWTGKPREALLAIDLRGLRVASSQDVAGYPWPMAVAGSKLLLSSYETAPSVLVYGLGDRGKPAFERDVPTKGWTWKVVVHDGTAYLPGGPYGVTAIPLAP